MTVKKITRPKNKDEETKIKRRKPAKKTREQFLLKRKINVAKIHEKALKLILHAYSVMSLSKIKKANKTKTENQNQIRFNVRRIHQNT